MHPSPLRQAFPLLLIASLSVLAQPPATPPSPDPAAPTLKVTTRLTRVDIIATDLNGHPVEGLKQSDFTVKEDGKPQVIKNFEESGTDRMPPPLAPNLPPNTYTNAHPRLPNSAAVNVLLIDNVTTGDNPGIAPDNVARSRNEAIKYVQTMPAGTQVIILELASKLRLVQNVTTDRDVLLAALHSITPQPASRTVLPPRPYTSRLEIMQFCDAANTQSRLVVGALEGVSAFLSGIKGRKQLIWFTPGIQWLTSPAEFDCIDDYSYGLERDYNLLATAQVAIYLVDPNGLKGCFASSRCVHAATMDHMSMENIADATGGQAFYNSNDLAAEIGSAIAIGTDSYSLSYVPPLAKHDGQYHKISVTVDRPGIRLVYRKGYTAIDPAKVPKPTAATEQTATAPDAALYTAMAHGAAPSTQIVFTVAVVPSSSPFGLYDPVLGQLSPKIKSKHLTRYNFNFTLPPAEVTLTDAPNNQHQGSMEFTVAAYDGTGEILNVIRETASLDLLPSQFASFYERDIPMQLQLDLPPGPLFLRAAVRDIPSNKLGTLEIPLTAHK